MQSQLKLVTDYLSTIPLLNGRLIEDVALTTSATAIEHGLGREPTGWFLTDISAAATVHSTASTLPKRFLNLTASSACTVNLWVF